MGESVWFGQVALMMQRVFMQRADIIGLGISYDMLLEALFEAGGAIDVNGRYPINDAIRQRLRRIFNKWY